MLAKLLRTTLLCTAFLLNGAIAAPIAFVPPNDPAGADYWPANDSWWMGRGITFNVSSRQSLTSVGLLHDLSGIDLSFGLYEISKDSVTLTKLTTLASGGSSVDTNGRAWIDYALSGVVLETGKDYLLEFAFDGDADSNFYYWNDNVSWDQGAVVNLDGTMGAELLNAVVAGFRVEAVDAAALPEPGTLALIAVGMAALGRRRRLRA